MNLKKHISIAVFYFLLVACMGLILRFFLVVPMSFNFKFLLHAHSHTALLGWVYLGLTTIIYKIFLFDLKKEKLYKGIFLFTNFCILGMLISFPIQGYALFSIIFSTLFLFASYFFTWFAFKNCNEKLKKRFSWKLVKASLIYLIVSSLGPWAVGGVLATLGNDSIWYKIAIYIYLHFQYNGWFILALLGILCYILEENGIELAIKKRRLFFIFLNVGIILTVFLSVLWFGPPLVFNIAGFLGATIQIVAFYQVYKILKNNIPILKNEFTKHSLFLLKIAGLILGLKLLMQLASALPYFAKLVFNFRDFIIGYLHLVLLGIVTTTLIAFLNYFKLLKIPKSFNILFLFAFVTTEFLIFYKAFAFWLDLPFLSEYYISLAILSCLFPLAVGILFIHNSNFNKQLAFSLKAFFLNF